MHSTTFLRVLRLGWVNYWRNRGLSISATLILGLTLFIVLIFLLVNSVLVTASGEITNRIDQMTVTFPDSISDSQIHDLETNLAARPDVKDVKFISKDQAAERFGNYDSLSARIRQTVTAQDNPLPRSLEITATTPQDLDAISGYLNQEPQKDIIRFNTYSKNRDLTQQLTRFEHGVQLSGVVLSIIFTLISMIVVLSTIRLAIFARHEEIEIMRLVGANNAFIAVPFVVEAVLYGLVAATVALLAAWLTVHRISQFMEHFLSGLVPFDLPTLFVQRLPSLIAIEVGIGLGIAVIASMLSIRRYLKY